MIGSHSLRKGGASYVASGSTSCPPAAAINVQVGRMEVFKTPTFVTSMQETCFAEKPQAGFL